MRAMQWEPAPYRTNSKDCFSDTSKGRYYICQTKGRDKCYVLRLNGNLIARHISMAAAQKSAEDHHGMDRA